jgi:rhodanese-related sulfurtransferase
VEDAARLFADVEVEPSNAVVIGAGFIGLEMAENLVRQGVDVTVVEATPQVLPPLDPEMAVLVSDELRVHGVTLELGSTVASIQEATITLIDGRVLPADLIVGSIGVRPDVHLALEAGIVIGPNGGIAVNEASQTSEPDIYAVGDAVEKDRQGRRVADHIAGRPSKEVRSIGTAIVKVFDLDVATTGWNERKLKETGRRFQGIHSHPFDHATYYPGANRMAAKLLFDLDDGSILGAQFVGRSGVDKRIDVIATAMSGGITASQLADLELAYAPPFSSAKDPVNLLGYMAENVMSGDCDVIGTDEIDQARSEGWLLLDVRSKEEHEAGSIPGSINVPVDDLRDHLAELRASPLIVYCEVGQRGHTAAALLQELGYRVRNLDGGYKTYLGTTRARFTV